MDLDQRKIFFKGLGGLLWLTVVFVAYFVMHKPFVPQQIAILIKGGWQVFVVSGIIALAGGVGYRLFPRRSDANDLVSLVIQVAFGFGILALSIFFIGNIIGFSREISVVLLFFGVLLCYRSMILWMKEWVFFSVIWRKSAKFEKLLAIGIFFILILSFAKSLAPPLAFDSLVYHLTLPKWYLLEGRVTYIPQLMFWGMPQLQEMGMMLAMSLGGAEAAILLSWSFGVLTLLGLLGYLSDKVSVRAGWVAIASLLAGYTLADSLAWGYVGWASMLFGLVVFFLLDLWIERHERRILLFLGLLLGFAVGIKYTNTILAFGVILNIFLAYRRGAVKVALRDVVLVGVVALSVFAPWLVKNWLVTGNPVYPLLFPAGEMDAYRLALYQNGPAWGGWQDFLFLPWRATVWGVHQHEGYSASIGALLLGLSVFVGFGGDPTFKRSLKTVLVMLFTGLFIWALVGRTSHLLLQTRLYLAIFPMWALLAGVGFERFSAFAAGGIRFGRIAAALVVLALGLNGFDLMNNFVRLGVGGVLLGVQTPSTYRQQALGMYESAMSAVADLPDDAQVLFLWETRGFSCIPKCEPDETIDRWYADLRLYGSPAAVLDAWRAQGYSHLLYFRLGADFIRERDARYTAADWRALDDFLGLLLPLEDLSGTYQLFALEHDD